MTFAALLVSIATAILFRVVVLVGDGVKPVSGAGVYAQMVSPPHRRVPDDARRETDENGKVDLGEIDPSAGEIVVYAWTADMSGEARFFPKVGDKTPVRVTLKPKPGTQPASSGH